MPVYSATSCGLAIGATVDQGDCTIFSPPSPASLGPYLAIVQEARANLAARGGPVRSGDVERLAFHLLKERNLPHD